MSRLARPPTVTAALVVAALCLGMPGLAQDRVEMGRAQPGPARGVLTEASAGDAACYLTIRDEAGGTEIWEAGFEMCEQAPRLLNRRLTFTWSLANILHPDCQGNMDCGRSLRLMVVTGMRPR